jgi:hypothetical protein
VIECVTISPEEALTEIPPSMLNMVDTTSTRSFYVELRQSKNHKTTKVINDVHVIFYYPTKKS